jgi:hypothetical protein
MIGTSMAVRSLLLSLVRPLYWRVRRFAPVDKSLHALRARAREKSLATALSLETFEERWTSQHGEDGILRELFARIPNDRFFVEFGVENGSECNAALLAQRYGWSGVFIEANDRHFVELQARYSGIPAVRCVRAFVTRENIANIFRANDVPLEPDLLSIDIDGNDYWVWEALEEYRPKIVVIEYNATLGAERSVTIPYDPDHVWALDHFFGASLTALCKLGERLGYALIGTECSGVNAFFVRRDLLEMSGFPELKPHEAHRPNTFIEMLLPAGKAAFVEV